MATAAVHRRPGAQRARIRIAPRETPKLRPCLGPGHEHLILSTKANRLCREAREQVARATDPVYGDPGVSVRMGGRVRAFQPIAHLEVADTTPATMEVLE